MSLVICSNQKDEVNLYDRGALDQAPYRFRNHLTNPVQLPPNSEVAVQSVKINKDGLIRVNPSDIWFQYFGEATDDGTPDVSDVMDTTSFPIMCSLLDINVDTEPTYVNISDYTELLSEAMRLGFPHPDADLTDVDNDGANPGTIATTQSSGGHSGNEFNGFNLKYKMRDNTGIGIVGEIAIVSVDNSGTGYTEGSYSDVATTVAPSGGTGATLEIEVDGAGEVATVDISNGGSGYRIGDLLTPDSSIGSGTGAVLRVSAVITPEDETGFQSTDWSFKSDVDNGKGVDRPMEVTLVDDLMQIKCLETNPNNEDNNNVCWLNKRPLSHQNGVFEVDLSGLFDPSGSNEFSLNSGWAIGLSRGMKDERGMVTYCEDGNLSIYNDFYDYVVYSEQLNGVSGQYYLKVGHSSVNKFTTDESKPISMNEVIYYDDGSGSPFSSETRFQDGDLVQSGTNGYNLSRNWAKFSVLRFELDGEQMIISLIGMEEDGADGKLVPGEPVVVASYSDALIKDGTAVNYLKPSATTTWCMTPKVMIRTKDRFISTYKYDGRKMEHKNTELDVSDPRGNWFARMIQNGTPQYAFEVDTRYNQFMWDETNDYVQNTSIPSQPRQYEDYRFIVLLGDGSPHYEDTRRANMQGRLGHSRAILKSAKDITVHTFSSDDIPNLMDRSSCFVRLDNFTQTTFNSGTGRPSRILYQVPRFDTSNRESGTALFYEPHQRTYVKLNNSEPLSLNELHLSLCDSMERLADKGIVGKTVICLHFQQSQTPLFKVTGSLI